MRNEFDNFDDILKRKLDNTDFSFNEANWEKAEQMLNTSRPAVPKKSSKKTWAYGIAASLFLVLGSMYFFTHYKIVPIDNDKNLTAMNNSTNSVSVTEEKAELLKNTTNSVSKDNDLIIKQETSSIVERAGQEDASIVSTSESSENPSSISKNRSASNTQSAVNKQVENETDDHNNTMGTDPFIQPELNSDENSNTRNQDYEKTVIGVTENAKLKNSNLDEQSGINTNTTQTANQSKGNNAVYKSLDEFKKELDQEENFTEVANSQEDKLATSAKLQPDTAGSDFNRRKDYVRIKHHILSVEAGAINSLGWKVNGIRNGNNISPVAGINYKYRFNSRSAIMIGAQYFQLSNLMEANKSFSATTYDFGVNNDITRYSVSDLQYLSVPMAFHYSVNSKNYFGIGLNLTCLLNVKNKVEEFKSVENNEMTPVKSYYDNGYGFNHITNYNGQFALSYHRKITEYIDFHAEVNKSIRNIFNNYAYFDASNKSNKPVAVKISLTYKFLNK